MNGIRLNVPCALLLASATLALPGLAQAAAADRAAEAGDAGFGHAGARGQFADAGAGGEIQFGQDHGGDLAFGRPQRAERAADRRDQVVGHEAWLLMGEPLGPQKKVLTAPTMR